MNRPVDYAFLHGGGQGSWVWQETLAALDRQTDGRFGRALVLDIPGCGLKRERQTDSLTVDDIVAELLGDIAKAGMSDVLLVGHSLAGTILPRMAEREPGLFRRLAYVSCSAPLPGQTFLQMMGSSAHGSKPDEVGWPKDPQEVPSSEQYPLMFCNDMSDEEAAGFLAKLGEDAWPDQVMFATDWRYDHLDRVPSTYVLCLRDGIIPLGWQEKFATRFKVDQRVGIDAGHQVMNSRPHSLAEVLRMEAARGAVR